jgi:phage terminase large subunit
LSASLEIEFPEKFSPLFGQHRYQVYYGGRGGAKSWACARALLIIGLQRKVRVLCTREFQSSIADSVHRLLADQIASLGLTDHYTVLQNEIRGANGTEFLFKGLRRNVQEIKSTEAIDICWVEEAANVSDESWEVLIPTVRNAGSQIWVTFNPRFKNDPTFQRFVVNPPPNAVVVKVGWQDNPWFPEELHAEMEHLKATDYDEYLHVWEGEFKQFADGSIYAKQLRKAREDGRICKIPVESMVEVHTFWDLGRNDSTAIWFMQKVGPEHRFIDYYENRLVDLDVYVRVLKDKGYNYGRHFLPHDVEVELLGMRNTRRDQLESAGVKPIEVVPRIGHINEGIEMTRQKFPSCWFDEERCERGLEALAAYQYVYDDVHGTHRQHPLHNWASNGADAFRQFAQGFHGSSVWGAPKLPMSDRRAKLVQTRFKQSTKWRV